MELNKTAKVVKLAKVVKTTKASLSNLSNRGKMTTLEQTAKMLTWLENEDNFAQIVGKIGQTAKMGSSKPLTKAMKLVEILQKVKKIREGSLLYSCRQSQLSTT